MTQNPTTFALKGAVCFSTDSRHLTCLEDAYLVCQDGRSVGVFPKLPEHFSGIPVRNVSPCLIIPGMTDLHLHAPQYAFHGMYMDLELLDWLNTVTFPEESRYSDPDYATKAYTIFADDIKKSATTRASVFGTLHVEASELLMDLMEKTGLRTFIGKVNMDRNGSATLQEKSAVVSVRDTVRWLTDTAGKYENVKPAYDQFGLFGGENCPTIMAHCVYSSDAEISLMKKRNVFIAHCPQSNTNLSSGIAPARRYLDEGLHIGLGTDIAGGHSLSMLRAVADAIQVSKLRWRLVDDTLKPLSLEEAFYMATMGGGAFFGKVGSFLEGYEFDALILDDSSLRHPQHLSARERLERLIYLSDDHCITGKYVSGNKIF